MRQQNNLRRHWSRGRNRGTRRRKETTGPRMALRICSMLEGSPPMTNWPRLPPITKKQTTRHQVEQPAGRPQPTIYKCLKVAASEYVDKRAFVVN